MYTFFSSHNDFCPASEGENCMQVIFHWKTFLGVFHFLRRKPLGRIDHRIQHLYNGQRVVYCDFHKRAVLTTFVLNIYIYISKKKRKWYTTINFIENSAFLRLFISIKPFPLEEAKYGEIKCSCYLRICGCNRTLYYHSNESC